MNTKLVYSGLIVALVVSIFALIRPNPVQTVVERIVGASPGDSINSPSLTVNGLTKQYASIAYSNATSTFCVVPRPAATSTLVSFTAKNTSATGTAIYLLLEKRTNPFAPLLTAATSTNVLNGTFLLAANDDAAFTVNATTTGNAASNDYFEISPSQYLVFYGKAANGTTIPAGVTSTGVVFTGQCNAVLQEVQ